MAFTNPTFVSTSPLGSAAANTIDDIIRQVKLDLIERLEGDTANAQQSGVFEAGSLSATAIVKKGVGRTFVDTFANIGTYNLQDGRLFIASDTGRMYHLKGSGATELQYIPLTGGSFTGNLTITGTTADRSLTINTNAGQNRQINFNSAGLGRWQIQVNNATESGSNAGSNLELSRWNDAGALIDTLITFTRSSGDIQIGGSNAVDRNVAISSAAGQLRQLLFRSSGSNRWLIGVTNTAEGGSNAGSNFNIQAFTDGGSFLSTPLSIVRSTGVVTIAAGLTITTGGVTVSAGGLSVVDNNISITGGTASRLIQIQGATATNRTFRMSSNTLSRWDIYANSTAEGGSNAGSDLAIDRYNDAGSLLDTALQITRSNGQSIFTGTAASRFRLSGVTNGSAPAVLDLYSSPSATPTVYTRAGGLYDDYAAGALSKFGIFADSVDLELKSTDTTKKALFLNAVKVTSNTTPTVEANKDSSVDNRYIRLSNSQGSGKSWDLIVDTVASGGGFKLFNNTDSVQGLLISPTGGVTIGNITGVFPQGVFNDGTNTSQIGWNTNIFVYKNSSTTDRNVVFRNHSDVDIFTINLASSIITANSGVFDASGYRISGGATSGQYLRGNGTNFVSATIANGDLPAALNAATSFQIASGATITRILTATVVWDPASTSAGSFANTTVTVTGAAVGDPVFISKVHAADSFECWNESGYVSSADTVTLVWKNTSAGSVDPTSRTVRVIVFHI